LARSHVFCISCSDRVGLGHDVFDCFTSRNISVHQFEAYPPGEIYVRVPPLETGDYQAIIGALEAIDGIISVEEASFMRSAMREKELSHVLNTIKEGVAILNQKGEIIECNASAGDLLSGPGAPKLSGQPIHAFLDMGSNYSLPALTNNLQNHKARLIKFPNTVCYVDIYPCLEGMDVFRVILIIRAVADVRRLVYNFSILPNMNTFGEIIYKSESMRSVIEKARYIAASDASVMINGENGTGKELIAKAIHMASFRHDEPFVAINCAALPENLLESELFGYEEGAFTGSRRGGKEGLFEFADKGTLFLDEIGDMPLVMQAKLLRVLQERKARRVGGLKEYPVNVRIISATNKNLRESVRKGEMRTDLFYRLNVIPLALPPLRERKDDIPLLAQHYANKVCEKLGRPPVIVKDAFISKLMQYSWPGNVRELINVIERSIVFADTQVLSAESLLVDEEELVIPQVEDPILNVIVSKLGDGFSSLKDFMETVEKEVLRDAAAKYRSSRKIGQILGISNTAVINKLKKYGLQK